MSLFRFVMCAMIYTGALARNEASVRGFFRTANGFIGAGNDVRALAHMPGTARCDGSASAEVWPGEGNIRPNISSMSANPLQLSRRIRVHLAVSIAVLASLHACTAVTPIGADAGDVVFLTETAPATFQMEALYKGNVVSDAAGCLRLAGTGDQHTVVWPFGFELRPHNGGANVVDARGRVVGEIGGAFAFGGGEVPTLHDGIALSDEQKAVAREKCPGRYWIVGEVP